jgi:hypothetical protein
MTRLFSYCIPYDDGAAPNPYWGVCTLAICKPAIRRAAKKGDWVVGTGSKRTLTGHDFSGRVVYAMEVTNVLSMAEYDAWTKNKLPEKIPNTISKDLNRRVGDSIYDFAFNPPKLRRGVHEDGNRNADLSGNNVLLSRNFFYFGRKPIRMPIRLIPIVHQTQGHKVNANDRYVDQFLDWLKGQDLERNCLLGEPDLLEVVGKQLATCARLRSQSDEDDRQAPTC